MGQPAFQNAASAYPAPDSADDGFAASQNPVRQAAHEDAFALPPWSAEAAAEPVEPENQELDEAAAAGPAAAFALPPTASFGTPGAAPSSRPVSPAATAAAEEIDSSEDADPQMSAPPSPYSAPYYDSAAVNDSAAASPGFDVAAQTPAEAAAAAETPDET